MLKRIAGIVGWIGTAVVFVAAGVRLLQFLGALKPGWERQTYWMALAGLVLIAVYALAQWRDVARFFAGRQARLGTIAITSSLVVLGIIVAVNYLGARENKRWDLTASKSYTLSDQTRKLLAGLDAPMKVIVFAKQTEFDRFRQQMLEYEYLSKKVTAEYVDPDRKPTVAKEYGIQTYNTIALVYKGRTERVVSDSEQDIANGIIKVVTGEQKKVYFVQGHGEHDSAGSDRSGYSAIATSLGHDNYAVDKLVLAQQTDVPADASVVVIAGPRTDVFPSEADALRRYLQKGGKLLLMLDPPEKADAAALTNLVALAHDWGITVNDDLVVDMNPVGQFIGTDASVPVAAPPYPPSAITDQFDLVTAFPLARSVTPTSGGVNGHNAQTFLQTGGQSWSTDAKRVMATRQIGKFDEAKGDKRGPVSIGAFVSAQPADQQAAVPAKNDKGEPKQKPETRVAVVGDSDFAANYALGIQGNRDLFMNVVSWLAQQENLIAIRPREPEDRRLTMNESQRRNVMLLSLLIPVLIFGTGVYTWWRRR